MPSNVPTVSRGSGRTKLGRPEASEVEGPESASRCSAVRLRLERRPTRPALRRPSPWLGMISRLAPTDQGLGGAEPGTVALGALPSPGRFLVRLRGRGLGGRPNRGWSSSTLYRTTLFFGPWVIRVLRPRAPGRHLGVPGRKKHGSLPGTMHARTSAPPPARAGRRAVPPLASLRALKSSAVLSWVRVHLLFSSHCLSSSGTLTPLTCSLLFFFWHRLLAVQKSIPNHRKLERS